MKTIPMEIKKPALEILALSMEVTEKTAYDCYCNFWGHAGLFEVSVCQKGDDNYNKILRHNIYIGGDDDPESALSDLGYAKKRLEGLLFTCGEIEANQ
jgi:hypothetical protein